MNTRVSTSESFGPRLLITPARQGEAPSEPPWCQRACNVRGEETTGRTMPAWAGALPSQRRVSASPARRQAPQPRRDQLDQIAGGIAEVEGMTAAFPGLLVLDRHPVLLELS